jgi:hypothetical protein
VSRPLGDVTRRAQRCYCQTLILSFLTRGIGTCPPGVMPPSSIVTAFLRSYTAAAAERYRRSSGILRCSRNISESIGLQERGGTLYRPDRIFRQWVVADAFGVADRQWFVVRCQRSSARARLGWPRTAALPQDRSAHRHSDVRYPAQFGR